MSLFSNRRKPKGVGRDSQHPATGDGGGSGPIVRRPGLNNAPKHRSKLRVSSRPGVSNEEDDGSEGGVTVIKAPKRKDLVKQAAGNNLLKRSWSPSRLSEQAVPRSGLDDDRPTYSKDYLNELRSSTPSTPRDLSSYASENDESTKAVDVVSKFGIVEENSNTSAIPTEAEIREKKERRARLAKEQDFISLDDGGDSSYMQLSTRKVAKETRLVRDDEDLAEGFDDFVEDSGRVALGRKAKAVQQRKERESVREMIAEAENVSDEDDSEAERNLAYEAAQSRNAMDGLGLGDEQDDPQMRAPTVITPIPRLSSVLERLRANISSLEYTRARLSKQMADLQQEKAEIAIREIEIQKLVQEAGVKYEQLRAGTKLDDSDLNAAGAQAQIQRGLETMRNA